MKKKMYKDSQLKHQIYQAKNAGKKSVEKKLTEEQVQFLRNLGFEVIPFLYWIETRTWYNVQNMKGVLKEIHYTRKKGKRTLIRRLNRKELNLLDEHDVSYEVLKYRVILK